MAFVVLLIVSQLPKNRLIALLFSVVCWRMIPLNYTIFLKGLYLSPGPP